MQFQNSNISLPNNKIGETPWLTESTVLQGLLNKHMSPKGKIGLIVVTSGSLDFVWEDEPNNILTADKAHPIVIEPERYHHVIITNDVTFKVEFHKDLTPTTLDENAERPGENFLKKK